MNQRQKEQVKFQRGEGPIPSHLQPQRTEKGKLFKSKFMERITRTPLWIPQLMFLSMILSFVYYAFVYSPLSVSTIIVFYIIGLFSWSFIEYMVHRFVYHTETESKFFYKIQLNAHGIHHQHPKDPDRLAMPPLPGIVLASFFFVLFWVIFQGYVVAYFPGFLAGYLIYITIHYAQHRYKIPSYKPWKRLWQYHIIHHYKNPYCSFGVSTLLWDFVFGTLPSAQDKKGLNV